MPPPGAALLSRPPVARTGAQRLIAVAFAAVAVDTIFLSFAFIVYVRATHSDVQTAVCRLQLFCSTRAALTSMDEQRPVR